MDELKVVTITVDELRNIIGEAIKEEKIAHQDAAIKREFYSPTEFANMMGIGKSTAYDWVKSGTVPSLEIAGRKFVTRETIDQYKQDGEMQDGYIGF